jgi:hypothetical protein
MLFLRSRSGTTKGPQNANCPSPCSLSLVALPLWLNWVFVCAASNSRISLMKVDSYIRPLVTSKLRNPRIGGMLFGS